MRKQILIAAVLIVVVVGIVIGWYLATQRHVGHLVAQGERTNILLLGLDKAGTTNRSDTMMLLSLAPEKDVVLISLPRDLRVKFANGEFHKLNAAYTNGGAKLARQTVSLLLGIEVPFYVTLDYTGFEHLIDLFNGVTLTVEERMVYDDERADPPLHIDIQPGSQTFDGKTALDYIRYRGETGDIARMARQQKLIAALLAKGLQNEDFASTRKTVKEIYPYLHTDLSLIDLYDLAKLVQELNLDQIQMAIIPGTPITIDEVSYLEPQTVEMEQIVAQLIKEIDLLTPDEISVAVYNGNGTLRAAADTSEYLKRKGFKVLPASNADSFEYEETYIVVLTETAKAWVLQQVLPIGATVVSPEEFAPRYEKLPAAQTGTDLLLVIGAGFTVENG